MEKELAAALEALLNWCQDKKDERGVVWNSVAKAYAHATLEKYKNESHN